MPTLKTITRRVSTFHHDCYGAESRRDRAPVRLQRAYGVSWPWAGVKSAPQSTLAAGCAPQRRQDCEKFPQPTKDQANIDRPKLMFPRLEKVPLPSPHSACAFSRTRESTAPGDSVWLAIFTDDMMPIVFFQKREQFICR